jgi:hypothetical protein
MIKKLHDYTMADGRLSEVMQHTDLGHRRSAFGHRRSAIGHRSIVQSLYSLFPALHPDNLRVHRKKLHMPVVLGFFVRNYCVILILLP